MKTSATLEKNAGLGLTILGFLTATGSFVYVLIVIFQLLAAYTQSSALPENIEGLLP